MDEGAPIGRGLAGEAPDSCIDSKLLVFSHPGVFAGLTVFTCVYPI